MRLAAASVLLLTLATRLDGVASAACDTEKLYELIKNAAPLCPEFEEFVANNSVTHSLICADLNCVQLVKDMGRYGNCYIEDEDGDARVYLETDVMDPLEAACQASNPSIWEDIDATPLGTGVIVGIVSGALVVLAIVGYYLWRYCKNKPRSDNRENLDLEGNDGKYNEVLSPLTADNSTARLTSANRTGIGTATGGSKLDSAQFFSTLPAGGLWDDEAIIAARIPR